MLTWKVSESAGIYPSRASSVQIHWVVSILFEKEIFQTALLTFHWDLWIELGFSERTKNKQTSQRSFVRTFLRNQMRSSSFWSLSSGLCYVNWVSKVHVHLPLKVSEVNWAACCNLTYMFTESNTWYKSITPLLFTMWDFKQLYLVLSSFELKDLFCALYTHCTLFWYCSWYQAYLYRGR